MGNKNGSGNQEYAVMKRVWAGIRKNPQYHANLFFISFCKTHPHYTKYFTNDLNAPLAIDARTSAKFRLIMEALGYLLLNSYHKRDQLEYLIGYIALVHKNMELTRLDMFNFGARLIHYLAVTFPQLMTPEYHQIVSNYIHNLLEDISDEMENSWDHWLIDADSGDKTNQKAKEKSRMSHSIYGHTKDHWIDRKREWNERLESWKCQTIALTNEPEVHSPEEDPGVPGTAFDDATGTSIGSQADQFLKSYGVIDEIRQKAYASRRRRPTLMTKRSGEMQYKVVETMIDVINNSNIERDSTGPDSVARQRRRLRQPDFR